MHPHRVLQTTIFRLTAVYVASFAAALAVLGVVAYLVIAGTLERRLDARIRTEMQSLRASYDAKGLDALLAAVNTDERTHPNGALDYAVILRDQRIAGRLTKWPATPGWSTLPYQDDAEEGDEEDWRRVLLADFGAGVKVAVAADPEQADAVAGAILDGVLSAFGAVLVLGIVGGVLLSLALLRRVETIRRTAEAIIAGDLARRIPVRGSGDDLDRLSQTLNRMLDRIAELMESLREVSANIAHDLKTPLARLRQRLEAAQGQGDHARKAAVESAVAQVDEILATFSALLRIAQIEAGTRRAGFAPVDLSETFSTVAEAFAPAAEDGGRTLTARIAPGVTITGDRELLTQMLVNVVENAIRHTGPGTHIAIALDRDQAGAVGSVSDDGPGVAPAERERIFHRFHRLAESHAVPGSGLGLSLVKAVADLHEIALTAEDAQPGLRVKMRFGHVAEPYRGVRNRTSAMRRPRECTRS